MSLTQFFKGVVIQRYKRSSAEAGHYGVRDKVIIHFGQEGEQPPKISILEGTFLKLEKPEMSTVQTQFYEAPNKEVWARCDIQQSKLLTEELEEPSIGEHLYFLGNNECSAKTRVVINTYWAPRNDVAARNLK